MCRDTKASASELARLPSPASRCVLKGASTACGGGEVLNERRVSSRHPPAPICACPFEEMPRVAAAAEIVVSGCSIVSRPRFSSSVLDPPASVPGLDSVKWLVLLASWTSSSTGSRSSVLWASRPVPEPDASDDITNNGAGQEAITIGDLAVTCGSLAGVALRVGCAASHRLAKSTAGLLSNCVLPFSSAPPL